MAQRFGGEFSPGGSKKLGELKLAKRSRVGGRVNLLFFAPLPLAFKAFMAEPVLMPQYLAALGSILLAAWLTREGLRAQEAFEARTVARRPAFPRKIFGAAFTGIGLGIAGIAGHGPMEAAIFATLGVILHLFSFGLDPMKSKGIEGIDEYAHQRVVEAVEEGEKQLKAMDAAIRGLNDRGLIGPVEEFAGTVRQMFRAIESDPRDLTGARRYLKVYLRAARDASDKFADLYKRKHDDKARADYVALLQDLDDHFQSRTQAFLANDKVDLEIEIDVLRDRLKAEGVALTLSEKE